MLPPKHRCLQSSTIFDRIGNKKSPIYPALLRDFNPRMIRYLVMLDTNVDLLNSTDFDSVWRRELGSVDKVANGTNFPKWCRSAYLNDKWYLAKNVSQSVASSSILTSLLRRFELIRCGCFFLSFFTYELSKATSNRWKLRKNKVVIGETFLE